MDCYLSSTCLGSASMGK
ncbi:hypothetical protein LINGRAHAP2_LOCUS31366 [Linum grandiflorum]